jgi:hypothetical protein
VCVCVCACVQDVLDRPHLNEALAHFALDALRYFNKFRSESLRPYMIFMIYAFRVYNETGRCLALLTCYAICDVMVLSFSSAANITSDRNCDGMECMWLQPTVVSSSNCSACPGCVCVNVNVVISMNVNACACRLPVEQ